MSVLVLHFRRINGISKVVGYVLQQLTNFSSQKSKKVRKNDSVRRACGCIVWMSAGTVGNLTSATVLLRPRMRGKSVYLFLLQLSIADTAVLYISAFKIWVRVVFGFELLHVGMWTCRTVVFLTLMSQHMAAWIVVLVAVDRFVAVWFPLKATSWCTVTRATIATVICAVLVALYRSTAAAHSVPGFYLVIVVNQSINIRLIEKSMSERKFTQYGILIRKCYIKKYYI